jgi:hypothetical protein
MRNMKHPKSLGLAGLVAVAAMLVMMVGAATASAAALPEFKSASGTFPVPFTSESVLPLEPTLFSSIEGIGQRNVKCKMSKDKGEVSSAKEVKKVLVDYTECFEESAPTKMCTTKGSALGLIITKDIMGRTGWITGTSLTKAGIELLPESGKVFAEFTCEGEAEEVTVEGCTIGEATPLGVSSTDGKLLFVANAGNTGQLWTEVEEGVNKPCQLKVTAGFFKLGKGTSWIMDNELETFNEPVELK